MEQTNLKSATPPEGGAVVTITNNLTVAIDIYDVYRQTSEASNPTDPKRTYTKLSSINAGETGKVTTIHNLSQLQAMHTGVVDGLDSNYYYQFPIKFMSGTSFKNNTTTTSPPPLVYSIEKSDQLANIDALNFYKYTMANPNSALTKGLMTALTNKKIEALETDVNTFFVGTKNFKNATLASWNGIITWLNQFTTGWQGPYYLYKKIESGTATTTPTLIAAVNIVSDANNNTATLKFCSADTDGNITYTNDAPVPILMVGDGTMTDNLNVEETALVSLTPVWVTMPQPDTKKYTLTNVLTGKVDGTDVASSQVIFKGRNKPGFNFLSWITNFNNICQVVGLIAGIMMVVGPIKEFFSKLSAKKEVAKSESENQREYEVRTQEIDSTTAPEYNTTINTAQQTLDTAGPQVQDIYQQAVISPEVIALQERLNAMEQRLTDYQTQLDEYIENGEISPSDTLETALNNASTDISTAKDKLQEGDLDAANSALDDIYTQIDTIVTETDSQMGDEAEALDKSSKEAKEQAEATQEVKEEYDSTMGDEADDSGYDPSAESGTTDPIEVF